jgi:hypothetical protein
MFFNLGTEVSLFDVEFMQKVVHFYNICIHRSLFNRFTPNKAKNNYIIERTYIQEKNRQLEKAKDISLNYYLQYNAGNILFVSIPNKDRLKTKLEYFVKYIHRNVEVMVMNTKEVIVLPLYCTKFLVKDSKHLDDTAKRLFLK